jgi:hypothetical protein
MFIKPSTAGHIIRKNCSIVFTKNNDFVIRHSQAVFCDGQTWVRFMAGTSLVPWSHPTCYPVVFLVGTTAGTWLWAVTSIQCWVLRMYGALPPLLHTSLWRGTKLSTNDAFIWVIRVGESSLAGCSGSAGWLVSIWDLRSNWDSFVVQALQFPPVSIVRTGIVLLSKHCSFHLSVSFHQCSS